MRIYLQNNVYDETINRIKYIFSEFEEIIVCVSGGKDSTVLLHLCKKIAKEQNRKLNVLFIDQEAEWESTIDWIKEVMYDKEINPMWLQMPLRLFNATSFHNDWLMCWDEKEKDKWIHQKDPISIKENHYNTDRFKDLFGHIATYHFPNKKVAMISGVRAEESPGRLLAMTASLTYKQISWGKKYDYNPNLITFYPIYDWSYTDVWKCIHDNKLRYNKLYDYQYRYGVSLNNMRVSNLHHETAVHSLFYAHEIEKETFQKLSDRLEGISTASHLGFKDFYPTKLPKVFGTWKEYRDYLLDNLIEDAYKRKRMKSVIDAQDKKYSHIINYDNYVKAHINAIVSNDWEGTKLLNTAKQLQREVCKKTNVVRKK